MKSHYFLIGTVIGLALIPVVAFSIAGAGAVSFLLNPSFVPILVGYAAAIAAARFVDGKVQPTALKGPIATAGIFLFGVTAACITNLFAMGQPFTPHFSLASEVRDYVGKPAFWLVTIGTPCAIMIGIVQFLVTKLVRSR
jgi:hypothetical protein